MIQIRQKKQAFHSQIRRESIQNYFKRIRQKFINNQFKFQNSQEQRDENYQKIINMFNKTFEQKQIIKQIRNNNFLGSLNQLINQIRNSKQYEDKRLLLIMFGNILKHQFNQLNIYQKQQIVKFSFTILESLQIFQFDFVNNKDCQKIEQIFKIIQPSIFIFCFDQIIQLYQWLDQQEQIYIENNIYKTFIKILFYVIKNQRQIKFIQQFIQGSERCLVNFFNHSQQSYEMGNKMKAERNISLFMSMIYSHQSILYKNQQFPFQYKKIQTKLYWFYDYLTTYIENLIPFFKNQKIFYVILKGLDWQENSKLSTKIKNSSLSMLKTYLQTGIFTEQINNFLFVNSFNSNLTNFQKILQNITEIKLQYNIFQLIQQLILIYQKQNDYQTVINHFGKNIVQICVNYLIKIKDDIYNIEDYKQTLIKVLSILYQLIQVGNRKENLSNYKNIFSAIFQSLSGLNYIQSIHIFIQKLSYQTDQKLCNIISYIQWFQQNIFELQIDI